MKRLFGLLAAALLIVPALTGCIAATSTLDTYPPDQRMLTESGGLALAAVKASNRGLYLFYWFPIWSGKPQTPNLYRYKVFKDYLLKGYMTLMLDEARHDLGGQSVEDIRHVSRANGWWGLGVLWSRSMYAEGVVVGDAKAKDGKKKK